MDMRLLEEGTPNHKYAVKGRMSRVLAVCFDFVEACCRLLGWCCKAFCELLDYFCSLCDCLDHENNSMYKNHICLVSRNATYLGAVKRALQRMCLCDQNGVGVTISEKHISAAPGSSFWAEDFDRAQLVLFVVLSEPRMQIISSTEESSIGDIFKRAQRWSVESMVVLVGHTNSDCLPEHQLYHPTLESVCVNQPDIGTLARKNRFLSLGYLYNADDLDFNDAQKDALVKWAQSIIPGCHFQNKSLDV